MQQLNQKFLNYAKNMRDQSWHTFEGILILHNNLLTCYQFGKELSKTAMDLDEYTIYKTLAHTIIFYSQKHNQRYEKINDLCESLQTKIKESLEKTSINIDSVCNYNIPTLKRLSSELYLQSLHKIVQQYKTLYFNNEWPKSLLILVAGPASPRFGHPAMQYFTRLTNNELEINSQMIKDDIKFNVLDDAKYIGRKLYYIENCNEYDKIIEIGLSLYIEETEFSKYESMKKDILSKPTQEYLLEKCNK